MLWRVSEHEPLAGETWNEVQAAAGVRLIVNDAEATRVNGFWPGHPQEGGNGSPICSVYLGSAGMLWGLMRLGTSIDVGAAAERLVDAYRAAPDFADDPDEGAHPSSLWMGETGVLLTAARAGSRVDHSKRLASLLDANRENPRREFLYGSAGTLMAARAMKMVDCEHASAEWLAGQWDLETDLWTQDFGSQVAQFLGAGHGFAGNVNALRGFVDEALLRARVERLLTATALRDDDRELVNWLPTMQAPADSIRVQWCHGAPGIVTAIGDLMPLEMAEAAGELTWRAGPLAKGAGLCHGTAGNGYALLRLFSMTGEERWLSRARSFAMHALAQVEESRARLRCGRYTLWTGDLGVAVFVQDCLRGEARMPFIDDL